MSKLHVPDLFATRSAFRDERLGVFDGAFAPAIAGFSDSIVNAAVFATGSMGRGELGAHSDLDLMIVDTTRGEADALGALQAIRLQAALISANEEAEFPEFDGDGSFIKVHAMEDLNVFLGTQQDDQFNVFTARMLLILESKVLWNQGAYNRLLDFVLDEIYFRDETPEREDFVPLFLINDVIRFWKTLCLAYEAKRRKNPNAKGKTRHELLKLRFSRSWTCFNGIAFLLADTDQRPQRERARMMVDLSPAERWESIAADHVDLTSQIGEVLRGYEWFLERTDRKKSELRDSLEGLDDVEWNDVRMRGAAFCDVLGDIVTSLAERSKLKSPRKLVI